MTNLKILMADDEPEVLDIMAKNIVAQGYTAVKAKDGEEAWEKIQSELPDIILLDLNMPRMNGFEVLRALREYPPSRKWQPVIIVSTRRELEDIQKIMMDYMQSLMCMQKIFQNTFQKRLQ